MDWQSVVLLVWIVLLLAAVGGVFLGVLRPVGRKAARNVEWLCAWLARHRAWVLFVVIGVGFVLGSISAWRSLGSGSAAGYGQSGVGRFVDMAYESVRELTGEASPKPENPLLSRMARAAGLAGIVLLAFELIVKLFHEPVQRFRLLSRRDHIVICGLGRIGRELTAACGDAGMDVVVLEKDAENPAIAEAIEAGALVWIGDLTSKSALRVIGAARARHVFFVSGSDEQNLEAASDLLMVLLDPGQKVSDGRTRPPKVTLHLDRPELDVLLIRMKRELNEPVQAVKEWILNKSQYWTQIPEKWKHVDKTRDRLVRDGFDLRAFNVADRAIQDLFDAHVIDRRPVRAAGTDAEIAHFVILGFGPAGQRLALHLAGQAHFENQRRSRMTIVYAPEDALRIERFRSEFPALFPTQAIFKDAGSEFSGVDPESAEYAWTPDARLDDWGFGVRVADVKNPTDADRGVRFVCNGGFVRDAAGPLSPAVIDRLLALARDPSVRPMVFICDADDENNCSQGERLREELDLRLKQPGEPPPGREYAITIFPNVPTRPMLTRLTSPAQPESADLIPFGDAAVSCTYDKLAGDPITDIAKAIQRDFVKQHPSANGENPAWEALPAWERSTNLAAALHINAKFGVLGLRFVPKGTLNALSARLPDPESLPAEVRETIAIMEHNRWMAERLLAGWSLGKREKPENKRRHQFVPWRMLTDKAERMKDYSQLNAALRVCRGLIEGPDAEFAIVMANGPRPGASGVREVGSTSPNP
jgi:hypothetical protein